MKTNRDFVSLVRSTHRLLSADGSLNDRSVLSQGKVIATTLIKRELNLRKLVATDTIYTTIPCIDMEQVPLSECCDFVDNRKISRSKYPLPKINESNYFYAIKVFAIDMNRKLDEITPERYINILRLPASIPNVYFWIQNNYLYVTDSNVAKIRVAAFFDEDVPDYIMRPSDCPCATVVKKEDNCINPLDREFKCPGYLMDAVVKMTSQQLLTTYFRLPADTQSDNVDGQAPNQISK